MLPPEFRETLEKLSPGGECMLTNFDGCVVGYPIPEWVRIEESFNKINMLDKSLRGFQRFFISGAIQVNLDKQGRILVPPHLREYGGLTRDVALAGVGRKFEIWDRTTFEAERAKVEQDFDSIMGALSGHGFELRL